jgi:hypothetical protein
LQDKQDQAKKLIGKYNLILDLSEIYLRHKKEYHSLLQENSRKTRNR